MLDCTISYIVIIPRKLQFLFAACGMIASGPSQLNTDDHGCTASNHQSSRSLTAKSEVFTRRLVSSFL